MMSRRTNPDLLNLSNINELVIPPPNRYTYFEDADNHPFKANTTEYSKTNAWWMAEFATLIYEREVKVREEISNLTNREIVWLNDDETHTEGFVARFDNFTVVSFRGTELFRPSEILDIEEIRHFIEDISTGTNIIGESRLRGVEVHKGIHKALNSVWGILQPILESEDNPVWLTGHSLGGALAVMAAFKWEINSEKIGGVYTIGSPAIGGPEFKQQYNDELHEKTFQHVYGADIITNIGQMVGNNPLIIDFKQVGNKIQLPRVDVSLFENLTLFMQMPLIDHGPIFYLNSLWNQMLEST